MPPLKLIGAFQNSIKDFCEDSTRSKQNNLSIFRGRPSITFYNGNTRQVVVFEPDTKVFITAYKLTEDAYERYVDSGVIGSELDPSKF